MSQYKIHPIVMGTKVFDKSMMTYQYGSGTEYTIPIYCWYIEGGDQKILVDTGEMSPIQSVDTPKGKAAITGFCVINENFNPPTEIRAMEMDLIPPGTHINVEESYDIMLKVKEVAQIVLPLHEPAFAGQETIP